MLAKKNTFSSLLCIFAVVADHHNMRNLKKCQRELSSPTVHCTWFSTRLAAHCIRISGTSCRWGPTLLEKWLIITTGNASTPATCACLWTPFSSIPFSVLTLGSSAFVFWCVLVWISRYLVTTFLRAIVVVWSIWRSWSGREVLSPAGWVYENGVIYARVTYSFDQLGQH